MSPKNRSDAIRASARHAAAQMKPAAERAKPLARSTGEAARRSILKARAWAAPQVKRSGQALQDTVAPKVSAALSSAAKRIDPAQPRQRQWSKPVSLATITAAGGAVVAFLRGRKKPTPTALDAADSLRPSGDGQGNASIGSETKTNSQPSS